MFAGKLDNECKTIVELVGTKIKSDQSGWRSSFGYQDGCPVRGVWGLDEIEIWVEEGRVLPSGWMVSPWRSRRRQDEGQDGEGALSAVGMDGEFREAQVEDVSRPGLRKELFVSLGRLCIAGLRWDLF